MELKGYKGTYPDFVKYEKLKGLHLEESYNVTYFVGMEKRVVYRIYCNEFYNENLWYNSRNRMNVKSETTIAPQSS